MWVFLGMETIANIKYRSHVDSDSCLLAVCRWLIPHEVAPQQSFTMLQPANAKVIIKNGTTKNNHIYFILQFDPLKHSINNSSCNLTYTPLYFQFAKAKTGNILPNMNKEEFSNILVVYPPNDILQRFHAIASALFSQMNNNVIELNSLTKQRDELLPLLMNGQVSPPNCD